LEVDMPSLSIKNVPEEVIERLRERAERNHRSLQRELLALVCEAATQDPGVPEPPSARTPPVRRGTKSIREIYEEIRARGDGPYPDAPLAVDIIRADRDSR
jgi:plasmid stability protein